MTHEIKNLIDRGALFVVNHSGGKDSQAMMIKLLEIVPVSQLVVVHADLGRIEWHGAKELAMKQAADAGVQFEIAQAIYADGSTKDFLSMVAKKFADRPEVPSWSAPNCRTCTSDLKAGPIEKVIKRVMKERGLKLVVDCQGIRADESDDRGERAPFVHLNAQLNSKGKPKSGLCAAGREAYTWYPIFDLTTEQVFATIRGAGQEAHPAYAAGNERLSCVFCIMGSPNDIYLGSIARPELFAEYVAMEEKTGYTMRMNGQSLLEIVAEVQAAQAA